MFLFAVGSPQELVDYFEIDAQSAVVTQRRAIDRVLYGEVSLQIKAEETSEARRFQIATLVVGVESVNEYAPELSSSVGAFTAYLREDAARGTLLKNSAGTDALRVLVTDRDQVSMLVTDRGQVSMLVTDRDNVSMLVNDRDQVSMRVNDRAQPTLCW